MRGPGVVGAVAGSLLALAILAATTGCGSVAGGDPSADAGPLATSADDLEPTAGVASDGAFATALSWPIPPGKWASVSGRLASSSQVDLYDIGPAYSGDRLHVEVSCATDLNAAVAVFDQNQNVLVANDDRSYYGGLTDPLAVAIIKHASNHLYVAVSASPLEPSAGAYLLDVQLTEDQAVTPTEPQHVYLNFDGADAVTIGTRAPVNVPVFDSGTIDAEFAEHTEEIVETVVGMMGDDYAGLEVYFHSSRDGPPPVGPYTTVHFGTFDPELLGVAENIDEYNLDEVQEAIIFVDTFAAFSAVNPSVQDISQALANVASHEVGHLLGLYHCAGAGAIMDVTASLEQMLGDQTFMRAPLHEEVFPLGYQDSLLMLVENVGGDLAAAKRAATVYQAERSARYDAAAGPPARASLIFSTCAHCLRSKARLYEKLRASGN